MHTEARAARCVGFRPICCLNSGKTLGTGSVSSTANDNMSNWDYWRGTFEAAQAQAQVAASQASKFAEVVSAQVRAHMHVSTYSPCSQQEVPSIPASKLAKPLKQSHWSSHASALPPTPAKP